METPFGERHYCIHCGYWEEEKEHEKLFPNVICNDCEFGKQNKELKDKCERLEKLLEIAVEALKDLTNSNNWSVEQVDGELVFCFNRKYPWRFTGEALKKIKELKK